MQRSCALPTGLRAQTRYFAVLNNTGKKLVLQGIHKWMIQQWYLVGTVIVLQLLKICILIISCIHQKKQIMYNILISRFVSQGTLRVFRGTVTFTISEFFNHRSRTFMTFILVSYLECTRVRRGEITINGATFYIAIKEMSVSSPGISFFGCPGS